MRILFIHQNFPGQFLHLAPALAARGHEVLALTAETNPRPAPPGVALARYRWSDGDEAPPGLGAAYATATRRAAQLARAAARLRDDHGFRPDVIIGHIGWGETLFLPEVWPGAPILAYAELMYHARGLDTDFDPEFQDGGLAAQIATSARRAHMTQALVDARAAISPTRWQAGTFPAELRGKIAILHDGVDCRRLAPDPGARFTLPGGAASFAPGDEVLTYVSRALEPYRGFHVFLRALPQVLAARPQAQVLILGREGQSYGRPPAEGGSWKQKLLAELGGRLDLSRVHFLGNLPYGQFVSLLQVSRVHAYLTYPFVLSWSLIEAMAVGCQILASRTPPVAEVITDGVEGRLIDFFDQQAWARGLIAALADEGADEAAVLRAGARARALRDYDLQGVCLPRLIAFVESKGAVGALGAHPP